MSDPNPLRDEIAEDDALICPACKAGTIVAYFMVAAEVHSVGRARISEGPDSDSFLSAGCNNVNCLVELKRRHGDTRLRHAYIDDDGYDMTGASDEWDAICEAFTKAVEILLKRESAS